MLIPMLAVAAVACTGEIAGLGPPSNPANQTFASSLGVDLSKMTKTKDGLYYRDLVVGNGPLLARDTTITINYSGWLTDGTLFDSGTDSKVYTANVVSGFREGLLGMRVNGIRQLVVPSALGYGEQGNPPTIPRQATLVFRVQLVSLDSA